MKALLVYAHLDISRLGLTDTQRQEVNEDSKDRKSQDMMEGEEEPLEMLIEDVILRRVITDHPKLVSFVFSKGP